jgi:serine/threonine-protein kinase
MAAVEGRELAQLLAESGPFPERWVVAVGARLLAALSAVHAAGLVHGDVTPANVLVDGHPGEPDAVWLVDFGLAGPAGEVTPAGAPLRIPGSPAYLSPERARGAAADGRSDLYAVGVLLFELTTGVLPFRAATAAGLLAQHLGAPAPRLRTRRLDASAALEAVVARALEKLPARRFADAEAMRQALLRCLPASWPQPGP